jgi:hypothetical protein
LPGAELLELLERWRAAGEIRAFGTAATFERTAGVRAALPALTRVVQFESDIFDRNVRRWDAASACLTHGALTRAVPRLRALRDTHPDLLKRWSVEIGVDLHSDTALCALALRAAVLANGAGVVLMQSTSPQHIAANAREAMNGSQDAAVLRLAALLGEQAPA